VELSTSQPYNPAKVPFRRRGAAEHQLGPQHVRRGTQHSVAAFSNKQTLTPTQPTNTGKWVMWILRGAIIPGCGLTTRENLGSLCRKQVWILAVFYRDKNHSPLEITEEGTDPWDISTFSSLATNVPYHISTFLFPILKRGAQNNHCTAANMH